MTTPHPMFVSIFRALENYGRDPEPAPSKETVIEAMQKALVWHQEKEVETLKEVSQRKASFEKTARGYGLYVEALEAVAHHRAEQHRIANELATLTQPQQMAAE